MKKLPASTSSRILPLSLLIASSIAATTAGAEDRYWQGPTGDGGDGVWNNANWSPAGTPTSNDRVFFDNANGNQVVDTTVTITSGTNARARALNVQNNKNVTIEMENNSNLVVSNQNITVGGHSSVATVANNSSLTFSGPTSGSANLTATRFYLQDNPVNDGTAFRSTLTFTGNLNVSLTGAFNGIGNRSSVFVRDGAAINTNGTNSSSDFYVRAGSRNGNIFDNNLSLQGGSISGRYFRVQSLMQVSAGSQITRAQDAASLELEVYNGGRLELDGNGISSEALIDVQSGGTLAVGLTDQDTGLRAGPGLLELNADATFAAGSFLEFTLFGTAPDDIDQIFIGADGSLTNFDNGATLILIIADGVIPVHGQEWSLFSIASGSQGITGNFDLSQIDTNLWDLSRFNAADGWTLTAIPEPSAIYLSAAVALGAIALLRRRRK